MFRTRHKLLSSLIIFIFLFTLFPAQADAQEEVTVEKAISIVKSVFEVPDAYSKFTSGTRSEGSRKFISLTWEAADGYSGRLEAEVNAANGEITSMYTWSQTDGTASRLPVISKEQAVKIAREVLQKAVPSKAAYLRLLEDSQPLPISGYGTNLNLRFDRYHDNILVANDMATVEVNMTTGKINSYYLQWTDTQLPSAQGIISAEKAAATFGSEKMLELRYLLRQNYLPRQQNQTPRLVYAVNHRSGGMIDAFTGKPLILEQGGYLPLYNGGEESMGGKGSADQAALTPEEIAEISKLENLLPLAEAESLIRELTEIPAEAKLISSYLNQDYMDPTLRIWNVNFRISEGDDPAEYNASINAETGELLSYYYWRQNDGTEKGTMTREEALKTAEVWLKKIQPEKLTQTKLITSNYEEEEKYNPYSWTFNYQRTVNGVPCPGNGIYISIERVSGKISSYNLNWTKAQFPGIGNVLGLEKANTVFLGYMPMTLTYVKDMDRSNNPKFYLAYMPQPVPPAQLTIMIDAVTGARLDSTGQEIKEKAAGTFDDIASHFAREQIEMLGQAGIMTEYGSSFHPDEAVKLVTALKAMIILNDGSYNSGMTDEEVMRTAVTRNWISKDEKADSTVTRARIAKLTVSFLQLDYVAKQGDMFIIPYQDAGQLPAELKGYAGLTRGLGIILGDGVNFVPGHIITRGETAAILIRMMGVKPVPIYW